MPPKCGVGEGIRTCGVPREELFVVSKIAAEHKTYESAAKSIDETLEKMGLDYLDMMIIHSPQPWVEVNQSEDHYVEGNRAACRLCFVYWSSSSFFTFLPFIPIHQ
ncbi:MAG: aldo/keto reductase [Roseburia intestinalis]